MPCPHFPFSMHVARAENSVYSASPRTDIKLLRPGIQCHSIPSAIHTAPFIRTPRQSKRHVLHDPDANTLTSSYTKSWLFSPSKCCSTVLLPFAAKVQTLHPVCRLFYQGSGAKTEYRYQWKLSKRPWKDHEISNTAEKQADKSYTRIQALCRHPRHSAV